MKYFFANCVFKNDMFSLFLRIYDVIKNNRDNMFYTNYVFENIMFYYFLRICNNYDNTFFVNSVFKNDIFMYILLYHLYQPSY